MFITLVEFTVVRFEGGVSCDYLGAVKRYIALFVFKRDKIIIKFDKPLVLIDLKA